MSQILNRLKQAEEERERVIAERKRLEAEADAGLAEREREELALARQRGELLVGAQPASQSAQQLAPEATPQQRSRFAAALGIAVAMVVVFWVGTLMPRKAAPPVAIAPTPPVPVPAAPPAPREPPQLFTLDRDLDAFAARVKENP